MNHDLPTVGIDPESLSRLKPLPEEAMDEHAAAYRDAILKAVPPLIAGLRGPAGIWMRKPRIGQRLQETLRELASAPELDAATRELAILVTATEMRSQFEWNAHEGLARKHGVSAAALACLVDDLAPDSLSSHEALVIKLGREVFRTGRVADQTYAEALAALGEERLFTVAAVIAFYALTAVMLGIFDQRSAG